MAISRSVQYNGEFLHDITLLTQCYYHHRRTRLNLCSLCSDLNLLTIFPPGMLRICLTAFGFFFYFVYCISSPTLLDQTGRLDYVVQDELAVRGADGAQGTQSTWFGWRRVAESHYQPERVANPARAHTPRSRPLRIWSCLRRGLVRPSCPASSAPAQYFHTQAEPGPQW